MILVKAAADLLRNKKESFWGPEQLDSNDLASFIKCILAVKPSVRQSFDATAVLTQAPLFISFLPTLIAQSWMTRPIWEVPLPSCRHSPTYLSTSRLFQHDCALNAV